MPLWLRPVGGEVMGWRFVAAACVVALPVVAVAAPDVDVAPTWLRKPTPDDLLTVWPTDALRRGLGGRGVIRCDVSVQGALLNCAVVSETPKDAGFGGAAIALTPQFVMKPATHNGVPIPYQGLVIPISFVRPSLTTGSHIPGGESMSASGLVWRDRVLAGAPWTVAPTYADVQAAYPAKARTDGVGGHAVVDCTFRSDGTLTACNVVSEDPKREGFGPAARQLAGRFRGPAATPDGGSLGGYHVQIPFTFPTAMLTDVKPSVGKPEWASLPTPEEMVAGFPAAANAAGLLKARVVLNCAVGEDGRLTGCGVQSEEPKDYGFGGATLALASRFRLKIWSAEGLPVVGGRVNVPIRYDLAPGPVSADPAGATALAAKP